ncbi:MAG: HipA N-terminal domain-containing protein [Saprospiraceae bacterium]
MMKSKIFKNFWNYDGQGELKSLIKEEKVFELRFKSLVIAKLKYQKEIWTFEYTEEFKNQDEISPLPDFPDKNKVYESEALFPFFVLRIPSLHQPRIQNVIKKENIDQNNIIEMLKRFGKDSISNPFRLLLAS